MARANAQGPDTLLQTDRDNSQKSTCRSGAGHTFGSDRYVGALVVVSDGLFNSRPEQLVSLAARHKLPAIFPFRHFAVAGGLMSYGANFVDGFRQLGIYTGRILKGAICP
jgi:hypothetical protein